MRMNSETRALEPAAILRRSRIAGLWYLAMAITGPIGILIVPSAFIVGGDAAATAAKIAADPGLWRLGILAYLVSQLVFIPIALSFRSLFASVDRAQARLMTAFVVTAVPLAILNLLGFAAPLAIGGGGYMAAFPQAQRDAMAMLSIDIMRQGEILVGFFWGLWLAPLGILVWKSGWFPKVFAIFLFLGCASYLADCAVALVLPSARAAIAPIIGAAGFVGEVPFLLWLLIRGARVPSASQA
jgi:hypothetical protein